MLDVWHIKGDIGLKTRKVCGGSRGATITNYNPLKRGRWSHQHLPGGQLLGKGEGGGGGQDWDEG